MPGWGTGSFENEDAQNWLKKLGTISPDDLHQIFTAVDPIGYLQAPEASIVIAAAEAIAAHKGAPPEVVPSEIAEWLSRSPEVPPGVSESALRAVHCVRLSSELKDLWLEADGLNEWSTGLRDLEQRLAD
jgi:hypothetical protein